MKIIKDFTVTGKRVLPSGSCLISLIDDTHTSLPEIAPGQFVEIKVDDAPGAMLRRPISVCDVRYNSELVLMVKPVGPGSNSIVNSPLGTKLNIMLPLGNGFTIEGIKKGEKVMLAGGGVGAAPLVFLARKLSELGADVTVVIGGRTQKDVDGLENLYSDFAKVCISTDDGSYGDKGVITKNHAFEQAWNRIYVCGPTPMMKAIARIADERSIWCEVSLENHMACGLGACLCCVQDTDDHGHVCVCTEGPVFNINRLKSWM